MYRVYSKDYEGKGTDKKWKLLAAFVWKADANWFIKDKINEIPPENRTEDYKIMHGNRNVQVFV